jgi:hypothetical protein
MQEAARAESQEEILATYILLLGAMILARAMHDGATIMRILESCIRFALKVLRAERTGRAAVARK